MFISAVFCFRVLFPTPLPPHAASHNTAGRADEELDGEGSRGS